MHNIAPQPPFSSSTNDSGDIFLPKKQKSYRFIVSASYRKNQLTSASINGILFLIIFLLYYLQNNPQLLPTLGKFIAAPKRQETLFIWLICMSFVFIGNIFQFFMLCRQSIEIDEKGITIKGFPYIESLKVGIPKYTPWEALGKICRLKIQLWKRLRKPLNTRLIFTLNSGKEFSFFTIRREEELYQSVTHTLTLLQAIETFYPTVAQVASASNSRGIPVTHNLAADLGKQVGHVAYTALILACISTILLFSLPVSMLDNPTQVYIYVGVGIAAAFLAYQYMRSVENKSSALVSSILAGGASAFLMVPALGALPMLLGELTQETFTITEDRDNVQTWRMSSLPKHTFYIHVPPGQRVYQGEGTMHTFNIYRGPLGFYAIPNSERDSTKKK